ncbi:hypothetical protein MTO96_009904 [Rhipicephalus appendiculatus]|uniref:24 kDa family member n=1 Tax=Rhipicephalus appendiculatus TaxID=34631 RepID=A0A131YQZ3_RHIAP
MNHAFSCLTFITVLLAAVSSALAACDAEKAVTGLQDCRSHIHQIQKQRFNASDADHIEEVCCSATVKFEDCIREAVHLSGCHHEVDYLVTVMMTATRKLLSDMYTANCWYLCSQADAASASATFAPAGLVAVALVVLWRT